MASSAKFQKRSGISFFTAVDTDSFHFLPSVPDLSVGGGLDVGVALLTDDVVDVVQAVGGDAGKGAGAVGGKVAVGAPRAAEIGRAFNDHGRRSEGLSCGRERTKNDKNVIVVWLGVGGTRQPTHSSAPALPSHSCLRWLP